MVGPEPLEGNPLTARYHGEILWISQSTAPLAFVAASGAFSLLLVARCLGPLSTGPTHEGLRSYRWDSFGEVTGPETLQNPATGGVQGCSTLCLRGTSRQRREGRLFA